MKDLKNKLLPVILAFVVIILDQISKFLIVKYIPIWHMGPSFGNGLLRIIHVANNGVAFSFGATWSDTARKIAFSVVPLVVIALVCVVYFRNNDFTKLQRWAIMGIVGGGLGNLIDRIFRAEGVVDFIDVKFFGIFGFERWPTFNVADSAVVVCGILLIISFIISVIQDAKKGKESAPENN